YALGWGGQLARAQAPAYEIPVAPTPHPLVEALGALLEPLGPRAAAGVTVWLGLLALSACAWVVYALGSEWFGRPAGALAGLLILTRVPVLSYGVRAYVDVPYLLLVLSAVLVETRRPRAGAPVLVLLATVLAGGALGAAFSLLWLRRAALSSLGIAAVALVVFVVLAAAGLPINTRYAFLLAAIGCILCGAGALGWTRLQAGLPHRR